jgi:hypothetical protein
VRGDPWHRVFQHPARRAIGLAIVAAVATSAAAWALARQAGGPGLELTLRDASGGVLVQRPWPDADTTGLPLALPSLDLVVARTTIEGFWFVESGAERVLWLKAEAEARVLVDGIVVLRRAADETSRGVHAPLRLTPGFHRLLVEQTGAGPLKVQLAEPGQRPAALKAEAFARAPATPPSTARRFGRGLVRVAVLAWIGVGALCGLLAVVERRARGCWPRWWTHGALPALLVAFGGALRFDAVVSSYWLADAPLGARWLQAAIAPLQPGGSRFLPPEYPYAGDPFLYLKLAREARGFYDASGREPLYVHAARPLLALVDGHAVGINLTSALFSTLAIAATYALGLALGSWVVGALAAVAFAVEPQVIALATEGWRDDAFACFCVFSAAALVRLLRRPTAANGALVGVAGSLACLTRISSLSFLLPGLLLVVLKHRSRAGLRAVAAALAAVALLVGPFMLSCHLAFGDPLYAINVHTAYRRAAMGQAHQEPQSVARNLATARPPVETLDSFVTGLTTYPFAGKWSELDRILPGLARALATLALVGLAAWLLSAEGLFLLAVLAGALAPFAFTWDLVGGGWWRYTLHAYPFYLVAAAGAVVAIAAALRDAAAAPSDLARRLRSILPRLTLVAAVVVAGWLGSAWLRVRRAAEAAALGRPFVVEAGPRDLGFLRSGFGRLRSGDGPTTRACPERCTIELPLAAGRPHLLQLRFVSDAPVLVALNRTGVGRLEPTAGDGFGAATLSLPGTLVRAGTNEVELRPLSAPGGAGLRLWYVRVERPSGS